MTSDQTQNQSPEPSVTNGSGEVLPPFFAYVGINEAARLVGKGKQQIYRDIQAGKLSWNIDGGGKKTLQIADLDRVYKLKSQAVTSNKTSHQNRELPPSQTAVTDQDTVKNAIELAVLKERVSRLEDENRDLKQTRDRLLDQNQRLTMLLPAPTPPAPSVNSSEVAMSTEPERSQDPPKRKPWWKIFS